jgi:hypothetical protein
MNLRALPCDQDRPARSAKGFAMTHAAKCVAAALILCGCFAGVALAQAAPPAEPLPVADAGTTGQSNCISEEDHYVRLGEGVGFRIELANN